MMIKNTLSSKAEAALSRKNLIRNDDGANRVAEYESLLDLFTLISFILIIAAFIYVSENAGGDQNESQVNSQVAQRGSGKSTVIPQNELLIVLSRDNDKDNLTIVNGVSRQNKSYIVSRDNVVAKLIEQVLPIYNQVKINFAVDDKKQEANRFIAIDVERWLATKHCNYKVYFTGEDNAGN